MINTSNVVLLRRISKYIVISLIFVCVLGSCGFNSVHAVDFPEREIRIVVPLSPGGSNDRMSRLVASYLSVELGVSVIVENMPGAGGAIGTVEVLQAPADGYTILNMTSPGRELVSFQSKAFNMSDLRMLAGLMLDPAAILVRPDGPYETFEDLLEDIKSKPPGTIKTGQTGPWSSAYLTLKRIEEALGIEVTFIPFEGGAPALAAMLGGHIDFQIANIARNYPLHEEGTVRLLVQISKERHPSAPDIPTLEELTGAPVYAATLRGFAVRADTPAPIFEKLTAAIEKIATNEEFIAEFKRVAGAYKYTTGEEYDKLGKEYLRVVESYFGDQ
jgi:tripartite-type tricarboxylate transporter receptor subunit TctC